MLLELLREFHRLSSLLWQQYLLSGPGSLNPESFQPIDVAAGKLHELLAEVGGGIDRAAALRAISRIQDLAERCACRLEGLCFVTGEAGLIPRQQDHQAYESSLQQVQLLLEELESPRG